MADPLLRARAAVSQAGQLMRTGIANADLDETLRQADRATQELRTNELSPRQYYELWIQVCDELRHVQGFFELAERAQGVRLVDLYQKVQYAGNVLPRLYMMCTAGAVFAAKDKAASKEVLRDMLEMLHGVQHPTRGLFLRHYLNQVTKDKLGALGDTPARCEFCLSNFAEMARLWVRMGHQAASSAGKDPATRETERRQLKQLVGSNLVRLSEEVGDANDLHTYQAVVLPRVLRIIETCGDAVAQTYLLEITTQVMPNEFQLATLDVFLACAVGERLEAGVDLRLVLGNLITRFAADPAAAGHFDTFLRACQKAAKRAAVGLADVLDVCVSLGRFAAAAPAPDRLERLDRVMRLVADVVAEQRAAAVKLSEQDEALVAELAALPFKAGAALQAVLALGSYTELEAQLSPAARTGVAAKLLRAVVDAPPGEELEEAHVHRFFECAQAALADLASAGLVAKALQRVGRDEDPDAAASALDKARAHLCKAPPACQATTLPALVARYLGLLTRGGGGAQAFQTAHELCASLGAMDNARAKQRAARLFLQAFVVADRLGNATAADEYMVQALTLYEETPDSRLQALLLPSIVGALQVSVCLAKDALEAFQQKTALYAAGLLRKPDQVRAIVLSCHLFWSVSPERALRPGEAGPVPGRNSKRTLECLQRALKVADLCPPEQQLGLFVDVLNAYIFMLGAGAGDKVKPSYVSGLITLIREKAAASRDGKAVAYFEATLAHLRRLQEARGSVFGDVVVDVAE